MQSLLHAICVCVISRSILLCLFTAVTGDSLPTATHATTTTCQVGDSYPTSCEYTCDTGYELSSDDTSVTINCQADGQWSQIDITCYGRYKYSGFLN